MHTYGGRPVDKLMRSAIFLVSSGCCTERLARFVELTLAVYPFEIVL